MRIVFVGTGPFALTALDLLVRDGGRGGGGARGAGGEGGHVTVAGVVTAPPRRRGRGLRLAEGPVARLAGERGLDLLATEDLNDPTSLDWVRRRAPAALAVVDYGRKLRREILALPEHGCVNLHPSLLPRHRGASPIQYAILCGDRHTGVSIIRMVERMDAGPVLARVATPVRPGECAGDLAARLAPLGARLLRCVLEGLEAGAVVPREQDEEGGEATLAPKIRREDRVLAWDATPEMICRWIRALSPRPGAVGFLVRPGRGAPLRLTLLEAEPVPGPMGDPGSVVVSHGDEWVVAAGTGGVRLRRVKPAGRAALGAGDFLRGSRVQIGDRLEAAEPGG